MPKKIDRIQVFDMMRWGVPNSIIAERLGCSVRTIRRHVKGLKAYYRERPLWSVLVETKYEFLLWEEMRQWDMSYADIAYNFGFSRQHIYQQLEERRDEIYWSILRVSVRQAREEIALRMIAQNEKEKRGISD